MPRKILRSAAVVAALSALVKLVGLVKESVVAAVFGVTAALDAYLLAFTALSLPIGFFASYQLSLVSTLARLRQRGDLGAARVVLRQATVLGLLVAALIAPVMVAFAPALVGVMGGGTDDPDRFSRYALLLLPFGVAAGVTAPLYAALQAERRFLIASMLPVATPLFTIAIVLCWRGLGDPVLLIYGVVAGVAAEVAVLAYLARRSLGGTVPLLPLAGAVKLVARQGSVLCVGSTAFALTTLVDQTYAAGIGGGSVAAITFASKVPIALAALGGTALGTVALPHFAARLASGETIAAKRGFLRVIALMVPLALVAGALGWFASEMIVRVLFERGSFDRASTELVAGIQKLYFLQLPGFWVTVVAHRFLTAANAYRAVSAVSVGGLVATLLLDPLLIHFFGIHGLPLAAALVYLGMAAALVAIVLRARS